MSSVAYAAGVPSISGIAPPARSTRTQSPGLSAVQIAGLLYDRAYSAWLIAKASHQECEWCSADLAGLLRDAEGQCPLEHHATTHLATWILCGLTNGPLEGELASEFLDAVTIALRERVRTHTASLWLSSLPAQPARTVLS